MKSHELAEKLLKLPDCEICFEEQGSVYDSNIVNAFYRNNDDRVVLRNWTNKRNRKKAKMCW